MSGWDLRIFVCRFRTVVKDFCMQIYSILSPKQGNDKIESGKFYYFNCVYLLSYANKIDKTNSPLK